MFLKSKERVYYKKNDNTFNTSNSIFKQLRNHFHDHMLGTSQNLIHI